MEASKKPKANKYGAYSPVPLDKNSLKKINKKDESIAENEHKQSFEQLLDDAILSVTKK